MVEQFVERVRREVFAAAVAATRVGPDARWRLRWLRLEWQHGDMHAEAEESPAVAGDSLEHPQRDSNPCRHLESESWDNFYEW